MVTLPTAMPDSIPAGTTVEYRRTIPGYSAADGWTLEVFLAGKTEAAASVAQDGSSDAFIVTISADDTATLPDGLYRWREIVSKDGKRYSVGSGGVLVEPNLETATDGSLQLWVEKALALVEARIEGRVIEGEDAEELQIAGRSVRLIPWEQLFRIRSFLQAQLNAMKRGRFSRPVLMRFTRTGIVR